LVLKVDAEDIIHKTEVGGVSLNLKDKDSLQAAFDRMSEKFEEEKPGFILQEYLESGKEVIMGAKRNEGVQPTIMFGLGGIFVETIKDVQFRLAPLSREDALGMIHFIKGHSILEGVRGERGVDIDALAEILIRLSQLASDFPEIDEMDLNPVFSFEPGKGAKVVDARLKIIKV
jgi:acetyltransferase